MYFSVISPEPGREMAAAHDASQNAYGEHQWLWKFLPAPEGSKRDFLFRRSDIGDMPRFYVLSKRQPKSINSNWRVQTREFAPQLKAGDRLQFELRANPVVTTSSDGGKSKRHDVVMQEKKRLMRERGIARWGDWRGDDKPSIYTLAQETCGQWLSSRGARLGFSVDEQSLSVDEYQQHRGKNDMLRFSSVDFSGTLTVQDPRAFEDALFNGIGHAKAFGCGLMLIKRA